MKTTITFGRMNPPTRGHEKLVNKVKELAGDGDHHIFTSQTHDPRRNPLSPEQKHGYLKSSFPDTNIVSQPSPFHALHQLQDDGYKDVTVVVGADRIGEFERIGGHKDFNFDNYSVVSAGERGGGEIENISASGARAAAKEKQYGEFKQMLPTLMSKSQARSMFSDLRTQMEEFNLTEELFSDEEELDLFFEAFFPMKYLFEQDTYAAQNMAMDTMRGGPDYGEDNKDRDRKRLDRQQSRMKGETNPWPELLIIRTANDNKIRLVPKADYDSRQQEILAGNYPGSPPMGEVTPQIAFSAMQEPDFEASKTSNRILKMFGVTDPNQLDIGSQAAPGAGAPPASGGGVISPEDQAMGGMMPGPRTPPDGREITDPSSIFPDWDHQPVELIGSGVMMWNMLTGRNPMDGNVPPQLPQALDMSATLSSSGERFGRALLQQISPEYVAYDNAQNPANLNPSWIENGGSDNTPKADLVFVNPAAQDYIRANVGVGKHQIMSDDPNEAAALFHTLGNNGMVNQFAQRKEVKKFTTDLKTKLNQTFSSIEEKGKTIREGKEDVFSEATRIYDEISGTIEDLMAVDKGLKKVILREALTGEFKFGPDNIATATHVIATNKDGTNTQLQPITDFYISRLNDMATVNVLFTPANIEEKIETAETAGDTFIDYLRVLTQNMEDTLDLDDLAFRKRDYETNTDFALDGGSGELFSVADPLSATSEEPEKANFNDVATQQNLRMMVQRATEGFDNILDVMKFFNIGIEAIDIDPINLTLLNEAKADKYNIVTVNGKRFRIPVDQDAQDIMDDYNYIDAVFRETLLEGYKNRKKRSRKPNGGCEECARLKEEGKPLSEYCYQNCGKKGEKLKDSRKEHVKVNRDKGTYGNGDGYDESKTKKGTYVKEKPSINRKRNGKDGSSRLREEHGAGDMGTPELLLKYLRDTPGAGPIIGYDLLNQLLKKKKNEVERSRK